MTLGEIADRMDKIIVLLEHMAVKPAVTPKPPVFPDISLCPSVCPNCRIDLTGSVDYVCRNPNYPVGFGPVT